MTISVALFAVGALPVAVEADMVLTPAAIAEGLSLTTFATGFPTDPNEGNGPVGPLGVAFSTGGRVLVTDAPGNIRLFPGNFDNQNAAAVPVVQNVGHNNAAGLAQLGGSIYMNQQVLGTVVQLNPDGTTNQVIVNLGATTGIAADPANGHLLVSSQAAGVIYDVDPVAKTSSILISGLNLPDGVAVTPDGKTVYVAAGNHILGFNTATKGQVFDSGFISGVDGIALGTGQLAGNVFGNTNFGQFVEVNLASAVQTVFGTGGTRGDFVTLDPSNGSLLVTQTDRILRLNGFSPVAEPSSLVLLAMALPVVVYALRRRKPGQEPAENA
jgi:DNA-binding beta-propeller fold protein YncE